MREVIQSVGDMLMLKAEDKGIDLRISVAPEIPGKIIGDPTRLNQVLINLAGNAVKFTERGYVEVRASIRKQEDKKLWIQFDVVDTGIGIAPDHIDSIFDSFTQAGADVTRKFGGTGLGLTISKQLVNLMGGEIWVRSELQKGTTFSTVIPFEESEIQDEVVKENVLDDSAMQRLNNLKVLLVEDNEFNRMVAEDTIKETIPNLRLDIAVNGQEAVTRLQEEEYDIVLMDIQMPVMDGVEATKLIRNTLPEPARHTRIIAMTANVLQEDVQRYLDTGMNAYISKPFHAEELLLKMDAVMGNQKPVGNKPRIEEKRKEESLPPLPDIVTDMQFLQQFTGGNPEKLKKYKGMFLDNAPKLLDSMERALQAKDYAAIKIAAHSLKPQLSYMGVKEEVSKIFLIEQTAGAGAHEDTLPSLISNLKRLCLKAFEELKSN
jgi:CheY-like chemotaxis protein